MKTIELAEKIVALEYRDLPKEVIQKAKEAFLDTIAVTLAGTQSDSFDILSSYTDEVGGPKESTIIGKEKKDSVLNAALINSAAGHVLDYDDVSWSIIGHPAVVTFSPALALGEKLHSSGKAIITAFVAGYETIACIGKGIVPEFCEKGWHSTATIGPFGSTAVSGKLYKLDGTKMNMALGICGSLAAGVKGNMGTMTKHLQVGRAASSGVTAALLASKGYTASSDIFEGKDGFFHVFLQGSDMKEIQGKFCEPFDLVTGGAIFKKWPSCYSTHPCIEAVTILAEENNLRAEDVVKIEIFSTPLVNDVLFYHDPQTGFEAKFSDEFCAAVSIAKRKAFIPEFKDEIVRDPVIRSLMKKTTLATDSELSKCGYALPSEEGPTKTKVFITLKNGQRLFQEIAKAKGSPQRRLSMDELIEKYENCAELVLKKDSIEKSVELIMNIEKMDDIFPLMKILSS
jgi:2-methylcitrate dehydratase PrpD